MENGCQPSWIELSFSTTKAARIEKQYSTSLTFPCLEISLPHELVSSLWRNEAITTPNLSKTSNKSTCLFVSFEILSLHYELTCSIFCLSELFCQSQEKICHRCCGFKRCRLGSQLLLQLLFFSSLSALGHFSVLPSLLLSREDPCASWTVSPGISFDHYHHRCQDCCFPLGFLPDIGRKTAHSA
jgi:hypothetical protein